MSANIASVDYFKILKTAILTPWGRHENGEIDWGARILLHGPPGSAKTTTIKQLAKRMQAHFYSLKPGAKGQGAFAVTPVPKEFELPNGEKIMLLTFPGPDWIYGFGNEPAIVLVDEMNTAPPALQPPLLGLIQEKELGSTHLGPNVRILGAANSLEDGAGVWELAPAVANRQGHIDWFDPEVDAWCEYEMRGGDFFDDFEPIDLKKEEERVLQLWGSARAAACGTICTFLKRRRELLRKQPAANDPQASRAWPSPRTWSYAIRIQAAGFLQGLNETEMSIMTSAFIGAAAEKELFSFIKEQDLPDPSKVLDGHEKFEHNPNRLDRTMAFLNSSVALVAPKDADNREERAHKLWSILNGLSSEVKDQVIPISKTLFHSGATAGDDCMKVMAGITDTLILAKKYRAKAS